MSTKTNAVRLVQQAGIPCREAFYEFDELTRDLVEKTQEPVRRALSDAGLTAADLGQVLLVEIENIKEF